MEKKQSQQKYTKNIIHTRNMQKTDAFAL